MAAIATFSLLALAACASGESGNQASDDGSAATAVGEATSEGHQLDTGSVGTSSLTLPRCDALPGADDFAGIEGLPPLYFGREELAGDGSETYCNFNRQPGSSGPDLSISVLTGSSAQQFFDDEFVNWDELTGDSYYGDVEWFGDQERWAQHHLNEIGFASAEIVRDDIVITAWADTGVAASSQAMADIAVLVEASVFGGGAGGVTETPPETTEPPAPTGNPQAAATWFCVVGVADDDVLNLRDGAGVENQLVHEIPPHACDIYPTGEATTVSGDRWVEVDVYDHVAHWRGWVNEAYIGGFPNPCHEDLDACEL